jgi:hypothetical protein
MNVPTVRLMPVPWKVLNPGKFDEILKLPQQGLESVVLCAVSDTAPLDDHYAQLKESTF